MGECKNAEILPPLLLAVKLPPLLLAVKLCITDSVLTRDCAGHGVEVVVSTGIWIPMTLVSGVTPVVDAGERLPVVSAALFPDWDCEASFRICLKSVILIVTVSADVGDVGMASVFLAA